MMITRLLALVALGLLAASAAAAETRTRLYASGDWTVYRVSNAQITLDGQTYEFSQTCMAETPLSGGVVRVFLPPAEAPAELHGFTIGVVAANVWQFRSHNETLVFGPLTVGEAYYSGNMVSFSMTPDLGISYTLQMLAAGLNGPADIANERRERLASFSTRGMEAAMAKLNECGGLPPL